MPKQACPTGREILQSDWAVCGRPRERDGLKFGSSCGVEKKVRMEQFGSLPVCVFVWMRERECVFLCYMSCYTSAKKLFGCYSEHTNWARSLNQKPASAFLSHGRPTDPHCFIIINSPSVTKATRLAHKAVATRGELFAHSVEVLGKDGVRLVSLWGWVFVR